MSNQNEGSWIMVFIKAWWCFLILLAVMFINQRCESIRKDVEAIRQALAPEEVSTVDTQEPTP